MLGCLNSLSRLVGQQTECQALHRITDKNPKTLDLSKCDATSLTVFVVPTLSHYAFGVY